MQRLFKRADFQLTIGVVLCGIVGFGNLQPWAEVMLSAPGSYLLCSGLVQLILDGRAKKARPPST